uniref:Protein kinase domain-containing protein n=1 Tax=Fagus sylvatica TaxID=28930 RepID=A0A2N9F267_FAGSY
MTNGGISISVVIILLLHLSDIHVQAAPPLKFSFNDFVMNRDGYRFEFAGSGASIDLGALQITPRHIQQWLQLQQPASFNSTFVINIFTEQNWTAGEGLAFLIAPDLSIPQASDGKWLGLTNSTNDGNNTNQIVAIEFDTCTSKTRSILMAIILALTSTPYTVSVLYNGTSKLMEVYMVKEGQPMPEKPLLKETINLKQYVKQQSYFGFAASTGDPQIELNCVLKWSLEIDKLHKKSNFLWLKIGAGVGVPGVALLILSGVLYLNKRRRRRGGDEESMVLGTQLRCLPGMPREFKYKDLKKATNNFHENMKLGQGGFGVVYKGILQDKDHNHSNAATEIAVKKFSRDSIQSKDDFLAELTIIHRLRHKHLVRLVGWCYEKGKLLLLYDYMPNGSLDKHLYEAPNQTILNWRRRVKILAGVASALHYLHNEYDQKVVHRDLKASNILLDSDYNARLGDFGLARALDNERNSYAELGLTGVPGTMGYVAPECFHTGRATPESDVYGFGAVVLEVVCSRSPGININHHQRLYSLVDWVWMLHREGNIEEAVDERLGNDYVVDEAKRLLLLGLACSHPIASERPQTQDICQIISGTMPVPNVPPFKPAFTWPSMVTAFSSTESTLSNSIFFLRLVCKMDNGIIAEGFISSLSWSV